VKLLRKKDTSITMLEIMNLLKGNYDEKLHKESEKLRDKKMIELNTGTNKEKRINYNKYPTVSAGYSKSQNKVAVGVKISGKDSDKCSEDIVAEELNYAIDIEFVDVLRPRSGKVIPRCQGLGRCTHKYGEE